MLSASAGGPVPAMRLEPLTFVGYDRGGGFVHVITPQGALVRLRPSPPSHASTPEAVQPPPAPTRPPAAGAKLPLPPPTPSTSSAPDKTPAMEEKPPQQPLSTLAIAAPPDGFEVEFFSSSSSSVTSAATSRPPSRSPSTSSGESPKSADAPPLAHPNHTSGNGSTAEKGEAQAALRRSSSEEQQPPSVARQPPQQVPLPAPLPNTMVHGASLSAAAATRAEFDAALTQCALVLFGGRLPQQEQQPQPLAEDASEPSPLQWTEAVNYHAAVLLGFDETGCAYVAAQSFAQPVSPPQDWRLCPLPVLVCTTAATLLRFFAAAATDGTAEVRVPVLPRSPAPAATASHGETAAPMPPPPPLRNVPPTKAAAGAGAAHFLSPPLCWALPSCGRAPNLDLRGVFQVAPRRPYQLARHGEEVVVLGVALDVPWVRAVVPLPSPGRGMPPPPAPGSQPAGASTSPPAGYRWKDPAGWAEPLAGCHTAQDLRARHGLEDAAGAPAVTPEEATTAEAAPHAEVDGGEQAAVAAETLSTAHVVSARPASPPPPPSAVAADSAPPPSSSTTAAAATTTAPAFVKEGDVVFVPGRFGVLLECNAQPALLERQCGLAHGDRVQARRAGVLSVASSLRSGRSATPPPLLSTGSEWIVMGLHGRNVLVLLRAHGGEGPAAAVQVPLPGGVSEAAELFRKVAGAALAPPALPLEPPLPTSSSPSPVEARSVAEAALPPLAHAVEADAVEEDPIAAPGSSTDIFTEEATAAAAAPVTTGAEAGPDVDVEEEEELDNDVAENAAQGSGRHGGVSWNPAPVAADSRVVPDMTESSMEYDQHGVSPLTPCAPASATRAAAGPAEDEDDAPRGAAAAAVLTHSASVSTSPSASATPATSELSRQARVQQQQHQRIDDVLLNSGCDSPPPTRSTAPSTARASAASSPPIASLPPPSELAPTTATPRSSSVGAPNEAREAQESSAPAAPPPHPRQDGEANTVVVLDDGEAQTADTVPAVTPTMDAPPAVDEVDGRVALTPREPSRETPEMEADASQDEDSAAAAAAVAAAAAAVGVAAAAAAMAAAVVAVESESSESADDAFAEGLGIHAGASVVEEVDRERNQSEEASGEAVNETPRLSQTAAAEEEARGIIVTQLHGEPAAWDGLAPPSHVRDAVSAASSSANAFSTDRTPSTLPTPSQSMPQSSQAQQPHQPPPPPLTASDEDAVEVGEGEAESTWTRGRAEASPEAAPPMMDGVVYAVPQATHFPRRLPDPVVAAPNCAPHGVAHVPPLNGVAAAVRVPTAAAAPAPPSHLPHLPIPAMPTFTLPASAPPRAAAAPTASTFTPSYSPSPAGPADGHTAPRVPQPGYVTSYHASHSPDAGAAAAVAPPRFSVATSFTPATTANAPTTPTPFTSFLKAYAIFVLENYVDGGVQGAVGVGTHAGSQRHRPASSPPPAVTGLAPLLRFYRERPLLRITAATECQRRCRAAWEAAGPAVAARTNVQLRKLRASATSSVFEELCVDELVTVLGMVPHLPLPPV